MKKKIFAILALLMVGSCIGAVPSGAADYDVNETFDVTGFDTATTSGGVFVYPNTGNSVRSIGADEYGFRQMNLLVFDSDGRMTEAGGQIYANTDGTNGSPQLSVRVPAGGFLVAFGASAPSGLLQCKNTAMEGAMLYNATMSVIYEVHGSYDKAKSKLYISYDKPKAPSAGAPRFLFIGNSSTYFNGTPIKFKGLAAAAGKEIVVDYCTFGSAFLHEFADPNHERGRAVRNKLTNNKYDYVVFQDAASASYYDSIKSLDVLMPLVTANGAKPLFYMRYSSSSDINTRINYSSEYNKNYNAFAKKYNGVCAPSADGFVICGIEHPEINLYADDHSHHSSEGSYLIACTWLYSYLGIDPRGNSYGAQLPANTVKILQDTAYKACTDGYAYPRSERATVTINGKEYNDIAEGCGYVSDGGVYTTENWTDTGSDNKPLGKFTDGRFSLAGDDSTNGCYKGANTSITIDLGDVKSIKRVFSDLYGGTWGIPSPSTAEMSVQVSTDGVNFTKLGNAKRSDNIECGGAWEKREFTYDVDGDVNARYVRVGYSIGGTFLWLSEIAVYGEDVKQDVSGDESADVSDVVSSDVSDEVSEPVSEDENSGDNESSQQSADESEISGEPVSSEDSGDPAPSAHDPSFGDTAAESRPDGDDSRPDDGKSRTPLLAIIGGAAAAVVAAAAVAFTVIRKKRGAK